MGRLEMEIDLLVLGMGGRRKRLLDVKIMRYYMSYYWHDGNNDKKLMDATR
jgi:hypothetical protein